MTPTPNGLAMKSATAFGSSFQLEYRASDLFEVTFANGAKTIAALQGTIRGKARVRSLVGAFTANPSEIESITVASNSTATISLRSGAIQEGVFDITSVQEGSYDTLTGHFTESAELVIDCPGAQGGVMLTIEPRALAGKNIALTRTAAPGKQYGPNQKTKIFSITGLAGIPDQRRDRLDSRRCRAVSM